MNFQKQSLLSKLDTSLFQQQDRLLIAVSGGLDSVVLLDMLCRYFTHNGVSISNSLSIAHCNFGLREHESDGDETFVASLALRYQIPFFCKKFDTLAFAEQHQYSIQVAARELRYAWFSEILQAHHFQYLVTAHHLTDSIETIFYNLTKGTGIAGLHGILPKQGHIIRPLLALSKSEIEQYAIDNQLVWREDSSNATDKYSRNLIRHHLLPILKQINPNLEETFKNNILRIREVEYIFQEKIVEFLDKIVEEKTKLNHIDINGQNAWGIDTNETYHLNIQAIKQEKSNTILLHEILKVFGFNFFQTKSIINTLDAEAGKEFTSNSHSLVKDRKALIISPLSYSSLPHLDEKTFLKTADFSFSTDALQAHLDYDKVGDHFSVRFWKEGDTFKPLGMKGKRKNVSDFLNDLKLPLNLKRQVCVLVTQQGQIAWVIGYRLSEQYKVTPQTKVILELTMKTPHREDV